MKTKIRKKTSNFTSYLALTAVVGCASSVAEGAIQVIDLSEVSTPGGAVTSVSVTNTYDGLPDIMFDGTDSYDGLIAATVSSAFYGNGDGYFVVCKEGVCDRSFPTSVGADYAWWRRGGGAGGGGSNGDDNWVAFKDSEDRYGWLHLSLVDSTAPNNAAGLQLLHFVYDDAATSTANAPNLSAAVAAVNVPEPSSLALLALGSAGLVARRRRRDKELGMRN